MALTSVADTRLLLAFKFPPSERVRNQVSALLVQGLRRGLLIPSIVVTEYIKIAGGRVGLAPSLAHIGELEARGARIVEIDRKIAVKAGELSLKHADIPIADTLIASTTITHGAKQVLTDDPHFQELGLKLKWIKET